MPDVRPTSPARLFLVRHGQSTWNYEHRIQGQLDPPLSQEGRRQAANLGRRLTGRTFEGLYTSDLRRAAETAQLVGQAVRIDPTPMADLREIYLGQWEGLRTEELAARFPRAWASWTEEPNWDLVAGGEGSAAFEARVGRALDQLFDRHPQGDVLAVTHGGVIQIALHHVVGRPGRGIFPFRIQNASVSVLEKRNGRVVVSGVNDIAHLEEGSVAVPDIG
ncbi:MAG TPA: histidine phosphatase family protein [Candidatus Dormibacteraeota bacterium]|jgi:broad specificity phosphatase PhoE